MVAVTVNWGFSLLPAHDCSLFTTVWTETREILYLHLCSVAFKYCSFRQTELSNVLFIPFLVLLEMVFSSEAPKRVKILSLAKGVVCTIHASLCLRRWSWILVAKGDRSHTTYSPATFL